MVAKLFVADAPIKKQYKKNSLTPSQITLKDGSKNIMNSPYKDKAAQALPIIMAYKIN